MDKFAQSLVMALARQTFALLQFFERQGVDMSAVDEAIARFTAFTKGVQDQLKAALDTIAQLQATDAAEDAAQAAALTDQIAEQINAAVDALENPPVEPPAEPPAEPPVEPPADSGGSEEPPVTP
jgi:hypothetical protein